MYKKYFSLLLFFLIVLSVNGQDSSLEDSLTAIKKEIKELKHLLDGEKHFTISVGISPRIGKELNAYAWDFDISEEDKRGLAYCGYYSPVIEFSYKQKKNIHTLGAGWTERNTSPPKNFITSLLYPDLTYYWEYPLAYQWNVNYKEWNLFYQFNYIFKRKNARHHTVFPYLGIKWLFDRSVFTENGKRYWQSGEPYSLVNQVGLRKYRNIYHIESNSMFLMLTPGIRFVKRGFTTTIDANIKVSDKINSKVYIKESYVTTSNGPSFSQTHYIKEEETRFSDSHFLRSNALFYSFSIKFGYSF